MVVHAGGTALADVSCQRFNDDLFRCGRRAFHGAGASDVTHGAKTHLALHHFAAGTALVLHNIPVTVLFAVLEARSGIAETCDYSTQEEAAEKGLGLHYTRFQIAGP